MAPFRSMLIAMVSVVVILATLLAPSTQPVQAAALIDAGVTDLADAVVEGSVSAKSTVDVGGTPYTIFQVETAAALKGETPASIQVALPGGTRPDGSRLVISHTPQIAIGDVSQLALNHADPLVASAVEIALGSDPGTVYEVNGGEAGVVTLSGSLGGGYFAGANDFSFTGASWSSFAEAIDYWVDPTGANLGEAEVIQAAQAAFDVWENDPDSAVDFTFAGMIQIGTPDVFDDTFAVTFANMPNETFLARASWTEYSDGTLASFDIVVNTRYTFGIGSGSGLWFDLTSVLAHEVGHALGLGHVDAAEEIMTRSLRPASIESLGAGDLAGVRSLYPACNGLIPTVNINNGDMPTAGDDIILGTTGPDTIDGLGGNDTICGREGADILLGSGGSDTLIGGDGEDVLRGGTEDDTIHGGNGKDEIHGGSGNDIIFGGRRGDTIYGGDGDDIIEAEGGWDKVYGGAGQDTIDGGFGRDKVFGDEGEDTLFGNGGPDQIDGGPGADVIDAGRGTDTVYGGDGADAINAGRGSDTVYGGNGPDTIDGGKGGDLLFGEGDADNLAGGGGWDTLDGGDSFDECHGGFGQDIGVSCEQAISTP